MYSIKQSCDILVLFQLQSHCDYGINFASFLITLSVKYGTMCWPVLAHPDQINFIYMSILAPASFCNISDVCIYLYSCAFGRALVLPYYRSCLRMYTVTDHTHDNTKY